MYDHPKIRIQRIRENIVLTEQSFYSKTQTGRVKP